MGRNRVPFSKYLPIYVTFRRLLPLIQIILMIILGRVERHNHSYLRDRMIAHLHQLAKHADGGVALFGVVEPNGGEILRTNVDALAVGLLKVMDLEEIAYQGFVRNLLGVVCDFDGLQMSSGAGLHLFVAWVFHVAAHESDDSLCHAFEALEVILTAPEATC